MTIIMLAKACSIRMQTLKKMRAKWFCGLVAVSRFFKFPIQMNFAENKKWPTSPVWRATHKNTLGGYMRGEQSSPARKGRTKLRRTLPVPDLADFHCVLIHWFGDPWSRSASA